MGASGEKKPQGFAKLPPDVRKQISSAGGKAAHTHGGAHEFTSEEARAAGQKGGLKISRNREHMAEIGRRGGLSRQAKKRRETPPPPPSSRDPRRDSET